MTSTNTAPTSVQRHDTPLPHGIDRRLLRLLELKIKILSLAAEAQVIRHFETTCLQKNSNIRHAVKPLPVDDGVRELLRHSAQYMSLREHRRGIVRRESRLSLLAYAFLRGKPFRKAEAKTRSDKRLTVHDVNRVSEIAVSFSGLSKFSPAPRAMLELQVIEWIPKDAKA